MMAKYQKVSKNATLLKIGAGVLLLKLLLASCYIQTSNYKAARNRSIKNPEHSKNLSEHVFLDFQSVQGYEFRYTAIIMQDQEPEFSCTMVKFGTLPNHCPGFAQELMTFNYQTMATLTHSLPIQVRYLYAQVTFIGNTIATSYLASDTVHSLDAVDVIRQSKEIPYFNYAKCNYIFVNSIHLTCYGSEEETFLNSTVSGLKFQLSKTRAVMGAEKIEGFIGLFFTPEFVNPLIILSEVTTLSPERTLIKLTFDLVEYEEQRMKMCRCIQTLDKTGKDDEHEFGEVCKEIVKVRSDFKTVLATPYCFLAKDDLTGAENNSDADGFNVTDEAAYFGSQFQDEQD